MLLISTLQWVKSALVLKHTHHNSSHSAGKAFGRQTIVEIPPQNDAYERWPADTLHLLGGVRGRFFSSLFLDQLGSENHLVSPDYGKSMNETDKASETKLLDNRL
jgi:hypothetical protein